MRNYERQMEMLFIPAKNGYLKVFIFGFPKEGTFGNVITEFNGIVTGAKGVHKKRTIVEAITQLHVSLGGNGEN